LPREFVIQERTLGRGVSALEHLGWEILDKLKGLEVPELDLDEENGWVRVRISGPDEEVAENIITRLYGKVPSIHEVKEGDEFRGFLVDVGKVGYGLYFKSFVEDKDALYPLYQMRKQLVDGKKAPARAIAKAYGLIDGIALQLRVIKVEPDGVSVEISPRQLGVIKSVVYQELEALFIVGATPKEIDRALIRTGHKRDVRVRRLAFLSHMLICKRGTQARGLIPRLGPHLPGAVFSTFTWSKVRDLHKANF